MLPLFLLAGRSWLGEGLLRRRRLGAQLAQLGYFQLQLGGLLLKRPQFRRLLSQES